MFATKLKGLRKTGETLKMVKLSIFQIFPHNDLQFLNKRNYLSLNHFFIFKSIN